MTVTRFAVLACLLALIRGTGLRAAGLASHVVRRSRSSARGRARRQRRAAGARDVHARHGSLRRPPRATSRAAATWSAFAARSRPPRGRSTKPATRPRSPNVTLAAVIKTRADATNANAATFAAELWAEASESFDSAARRLETGDIRGARGRADEAEALFRDAELTAIKAQYLSQTRALLAEAEQARVPRLAPRTYEKARSLLAEAERELSENRYDTDLPRSLAQQANYEARHAIYLAGLIDRLRERGSVARGPDPELRATALRHQRRGRQSRAARQGHRARRHGARRLHRGAARASRAGRASDLTDTRTRVGELEEEIRDLDERLGGVSQERVALVQRLEAEERIREQFAAIENMFARDEARVSREGNRMIIRLVGLTFQSGQDVVRPAYRPLLEKVRQAAEVFPRSQITVEGPHGLVRRRREQPGVVAAARRGRQRVPDDRARACRRFA